jgi:hypothetical protein
MKIVSPDILHKTEAGGVMVGVKTSADVPDANRLGYTLITALQCITQTADGNAGFVRATIIEALCEVLHDAPEWREAGEQLLRTMDKFKFAGAWDQIAAGRDKIFPSTASKMMADRIRKFLSRRLGPGVLKEAA